VLTQVRLKELLHYSPGTGLFTWVGSTNLSIKVGSIAGYKSGDGYIRIGIDGKSYSAQRLAHLYMEGYLPEYEMDHKFGIKDDNRWSEIRHITHACNMQNKKKYRNNSSGFVGVYWSNSDGRWKSQITINGCQTFLGTYKDKISAALARIALEDQCQDWKCNNRNVNRVKLRLLGYSV